MTELFMADLDLRSLATSSNPTSALADPYAAYGKRMLDLIIALLLLPVLVPMIVIMCLLVRRDGARGLFAHQRVGQNGVPFTCWKIRTMVPDAQTRLARLLATDADAAAEWARTQKLTDDPRVTRLGRFLRRTSLDELPQIWNVLRGDMSLVGPRPVTEEELGHYGALRGTYLTLKPGVTGPWQVHGRSNGCFKERLDLDQGYASDMGLWRDLSLIAQTSLVLLRPTGR
ncbi:MAG: sugar transferase [Pseudomonadota bacterium]